MNLAVDESMEIILTNMCMLYDNNGRILVQKEPKDWPGITFPSGHIRRQGDSHGIGHSRDEKETGLDVYNLRVCGVKDWVMKANDI